MISSYNFLFERHIDRLARLEAETPSTLESNGNGNGDPDEVKESL